MPVNIRFGRSLADRCGGTCFPRFGVAVATGFGMLPLFILAMLSIPYFKLYLSTERVNVGFDDHPRGAK